MFVSGCFGFGALWRSGVDCCVGLYDIVCDWLACDIVWYDMAQLDMAQPDVALCEVAYSVSVQLGIVWSKRGVTLHGFVRTAVLLSVQCRVGL